MIDEQMWSIGGMTIDRGTSKHSDNMHNWQISMSPVGFEPTISAGERTQTYALDRVATETGN